MRYGNMKKKTILMAPNFGEIEKLKQHLKKKKNERQLFSPDFKRNAPSKL